MLTPEQDEVEAATAALLIELAFLVPKGTPADRFGAHLERYKTAIETRAKAATLAAESSARLECYQENERLEGQIASLTAEGERLTRELRITSLAVPLEEDLQGQIDEMCRYLSMGQGYTLNGIGRLLVDCSRRIADDWATIGRENRRAIAAEADRDAKDAAIANWKTLVAWLTAKLIAQRGELEAERDACRTRAERAEQAINVEQMRANLHATFNGGHETLETRRAFHHGMDTVCNVLASYQKGEGTNRILPTPERAE